MENLLIMPKSSEELGFLKELLAKLNVAMKVVRSEDIEAVSWDEPTAKVLLQMSAPSLEEVWEHENNEVWNSYLTKEELANV
ncbi:MAG: hypothetical protein MUE81_21350 [Thermoflexibacter sp.]|jgi:hypothetical protein|nr:hypothetical protein [Thermoflexibacter sp.]